MRRWLGVLTGLLLCSVAHAEIINVTPAGSGGGGGSFPPTGCVTANGIVFNNATPCDAQFTYTGASGTGIVQIGGGTLAAGANTVFTINPATASGLLLDAQVGGVSQWKVSSAGATTQLGAGTFLVNGAASAPSVLISGTWFTGGSSTTTKPQLLIEPAGTASTAWNPNGTGLGVNKAAAGGMIADFQVAGASKFQIADNHSNLSRGIATDSNGDMYLSNGNGGGKLYLNADVVNLNGGTMAPIVAVGGSFQVGSITALTLTTGAIGQTKITASGSAPGAAGAKFELVCGTNAGTAKLIVAAGTSATAVTVVDNIGAGVTGC